MLDPLFNKNCELVGWIDLNRYIFDKNLEWVGFINSGYAWSTERVWIGKMDGRTCLDKEGNIVAWNPKDPVRGGLRSLAPLSPLAPLRPLRPLRPLQPLKPLIPIIQGRWSKLSFGDWVNQRK